MDDDRASLGTCDPLLQGKSLIVTTKQILYNIPEQLTIGFTETDVVHLKTEDIWDMTPYAVLRHCINMIEAKGYRPTSDPSVSSKFRYQASRSSGAMMCVDSSSVGKLWFSTRESCLKFSDPEYRMTIEGIQLKKTPFPNPPSFFNSPAMVNGQALAPFKPADKVLTFNVGNFSERLSIGADTTVGFLRQSLREGLPQRFAQYPGIDNHFLAEAVREENKHNPLMDLVFTQEGKNDSVMDNDNARVVDFYNVLGSKPIVVTIRQMLYGIPETIPPRQYRWPINYW